MSFKADRDRRAGSGLWFDEQTEKRWAELTISLPDPKFARYFPGMDATGAPTLWRQWFKGKGPVDGVEAEALCEPLNDSHPSPPFPC